MKTISVFFLAFFLVFVGYSKTNEPVTNDNFNLELKADKNQNRTVVIDEEWYWGLPIICDGGLVDFLTAYSTPLKAKVRTHYNKSGVPIWGNISLSGEMVGGTGEIFKISSYQMKWEYTAGVWTKMELHFVVKGEDGTFYSGAGLYDPLTNEATNLRAKCTWD